MTGEPILKPGASLHLFGFASTPVDLEVEYRPRQQRTTSALLALVGCWLLVPLVFFIPPHLPWALGAFFAGIYFAVSNARGVYVVRSMEAACPKCAAPMKLAAGTRFKPPKSMTCDACRFTSELEVEAPEAARTTP
jgi:hypothetical protein